MDTCSAGIDFDGDGGTRAPAAGIASLRFERRRHDRWPAHGLARAYGTAGDEFGKRYTLTLIDESTEGMGARSDQPLAPGTVVSVGFAAPGHTAKTGVVLRCRPRGDGYHVAIRFETRLAA